MNTGRELRNSLKCFSVNGLKGYIQGLEKSVKDFQLEMKGLYPTATISDNTSRYLKIAKLTLGRKMRQGSS